jgi:hypothetical protein
LPQDANDDSGRLIDVAQAAPVVIQRCGRLIFAALSAENCQLVPVNALPVLTAPLPKQDVMTP